MRRRVQGLHEADRLAADEIPDGLFLIRVERTQYRWRAQKPYYLLHVTILEPKQLAGRSINGPIYCTVKALWKLSWFLRDFGYDTELLARDEIEEKSLVGLRGIVKVRHTIINGAFLLNLDGFAPASLWEELAATAPPDSRRSEVAR